jgi:hypothetical protein
MPVSPAKHVGHDSKPVASKVRCIGLLLKMCEAYVLLLMCEQVEVDFDASVAEAFAQLQSTVIEKRSVRVQVVWCRLGMLSSVSE